MVKVGKDQDFDSILSKIGPDATATFDNSASNPTEHASSEATNAATAVDDEDEELEEKDNDDAELEEDDEENEEEDVEDEAGVQNRGESDGVDTTDAPYLVLLSLMKNSNRELAVCPIPWNPGLV